MERKITQWILIFESAFWEKSRQGRSLYTNVCRIVRTRVIPPRLGCKHIPWVCIRGEQSEQRVSNIGGTTKDWWETYTSEQRSATNDHHQPGIDTLSCGVGIAVFVLIHSVGRQTLTNLRHRYGSIEYNTLKPFTRECFQFRLAALLQKTILDRCSFDTIHPEWTIPGGIVTRNPKKSKGRCFFI